MMEVSLDEVAEEFLGSEYELDTAVDPRVPSVEWEKDEGLYSLKVYSEEFLENDSRAVAGNTLEDVIERQVDEENDFYIEVRAPSEGLIPDREVYGFSEEEIEQGLREVFSEYVEGY